MKTEFTAAITQLSAERNLPKEVVLAVLESALASAYKKEAFPSEPDILVKIDPGTGKVNAYAQKVVVEAVNNPSHELSVDEAQRLRDTAQVGEIIEIAFIPTNAGRIAAQTAKQVVLQRLREAEHHAIFEEFVNKEREVVTGVIQFVEPKQTSYVRLNRTEAIFPLSEQVQNEHYHKGQRLQFYLLEITHSAKGPQIIVSRSHPNLVRRLFEMEIPEVHSGVVELKATAREPGHRTKLAVSTRQEGVDPVGCCLGPRGIRIQNIVNELNGEKIDVIQWHADPEIFVSNALSPAQVTSIEINEAARVAIVVVPDKQLSLAIGREGQNARLAARLTGWRIDIKSVSAAEAEKAVPQELEAATEEAVSTEPKVLEPVSNIGTEEPTEFPAPLKTPPEKSERKLQIRFAEDILPSLPTAKIQGKKKGEKLEKSKVKSKPHKKQIFHPGEDTLEE